jgi:hypothetical protein
MQISAKPLSRAWDASGLVSIGAAQVKQLSAEMGPSAIAKRLGIARSSVYRVSGLRRRSVHAVCSQPMQVCVSLSVADGDPKAWTLPAESPVLQGLPHRRWRRP